MFGFYSTLLLDSQILPFIFECPSFTVYFSLLPYIGETPTKVNEIKTLQLVGIGRLIFHFLLTCYTAIHFQYIPSSSIKSQLK